jgi:hypothetical protein
LQAVSPHPLLWPPEPDLHQYTPLFSHIADHIGSACNNLFQREFSSPLKPFLATSALNFAWLTLRRADPNLSAAFGSLLNSAQAFCAVAKTTISDEEDVGRAEVRVLAFSAVLGTLLKSARAFCAVDDRTTFDEKNVDRAGRGSGVFHREPLSVLSSTFSPPPRTPPSQSSCGLRTHRGHGSFARWLCSTVVRQ